MHTPSAIKQTFLKRWIMSLQLCNNSSKKNMSMMERRKVIKLSADLALASVRNCSTRWSRALIANASQDDQTKLVLRHFNTGSENRSEKPNKISDIAMSSSRTTICSSSSPPSLSPSPLFSKKISSKRILRRSWGIRRVRKLDGIRKVASSSSVAKRLVKKRTQILKNLVPGGESMDDASLIEETLDYMVWLRAQVEVMRSFAHATELLHGK